jgi:branched-chain amino acid transport system permease protein
LAFAIGSTYGGLAGALITPLVQFIEPGSFGLVHSLRLLLMVVVGGSGYFFGPFIGTGVVILLPEVLRFTQGYYLIIYSALVIAMLAFFPKGLMGIGAWARERLRPRQDRRDMAAGAQLK